MPKAADLVVTYGGTDGWSMWSKVSLAIRTAEIFEIAKFANRSTTEL